MFNVTDTEFLLMRQRDQAVAQANATIDSANAEILALRRALKIVKNKLLDEQCRSAALEARLAAVERH